MPTTLRTRRRRLRISRRRRLRRPAQLATPQGRSVRLSTRLAQLAKPHGRSMEHRTRLLRRLFGRDRRADLARGYYGQRSVTLVKSSVTLLGQYDTWSVSRPNLPPFRACEHASSAVLHGSPETLITGNSHACPKCEPTRARPNCLHNPPSIAQRPAPRDALIVNEAQHASRVGQ